MTKLIVFQATGEVRTPKQNEYFNPDLKNGELWQSRGFHIDAYPIYTRYEIEATPDVLAILKLEASK